MTKRFAAHFIFPATSPPISQGVIETDNTGTIIGITRHENGLREMASMEFHNGIICPAFIDIINLFSPEQLLQYFPVLQGIEYFGTPGSNGQRAVLELMKSIQFAGSEFSLELLIAIFTFEAAKIAGLDNEMGTLETGKRPGIVVIDHIDFKNMTLSEKSTVKKLI